LSLFDDSFTSVRRSWHMLIRMRATRFHPTQGAPFTRQNLPD
jgi:hypothetical protein